MWKLESSPPKNYHSLQSQRKLKWSKVCHIARVLIVIPIGNAIIRYQYHGYNLCSSTSKEPFTKYLILSIPFSRRKNWVPLVIKCWLGHLCLKAGTFFFSFRDHYSYWKHTFLFNLMSVFWIIYSSFWSFFTRKKNKENHIKIINIIFLNMHVNICALKTNLVKN